jgi:hypothetical protein
LKQKARAYQCRREQSKISKTIDEALREIDTFVPSLHAVLLGVQQKRREGMTAEEKEKDILYL